MPRPLAKSLIFIVEIVQDGAHCKNDLKFDVHKYYNDSKDTLLLHSVVFILFDIIRWFAKTVDSHILNETDEKPLWKKCEDNDKKIMLCKKVAQVVITFATSNQTNKIKTLNTTNI